MINEIGFALTPFLIHFLSSFMYFLIKKCVSVEPWFKIYPSPFHPINPCRKSFISFLSTLRYLPCLFPLLRSSFNSLSLFLHISFQLSAQFIADIDDRAWKEVGRTNGPRLQLFPTAEVISIPREMGYNLRSSKLAMRVTLHFFLFNSSANELNLS